MMIDGDARAELGQAASGQYPHRAKIRSALCAPNQNLIHLVVAVATRPAPIGLCEFI